MRYPSKPEPILMPWRDDMSETYNGASTMYPNVPAAILRTVMLMYGGLRASSGNLSNLVTVTGNRGRGGDHVERERER